MGGKCKFNEAWLLAYSWLRAVKNDPSSAYCILCDSEFKIDSKGESSLTRHADGEKHKSKANSAATSKPLTSFFKRKYY